MTKLLHANGPIVQDLAYEAARAACQVLDQAFPDKEAGGITSNFQGLLEEVIIHMLKGRSVLDASRGHATSLNRLVIDDSVFGEPMVRGSAFLVTLGVDEVLVLDPGQGDALQIEDAADPWSAFRPIEQATDAWISFEVAAEAALKFCRMAGMSTFDVIHSRITVKPVVPRANAECGYLLADPFSKTEESR